MKKQDEFKPRAQTCSSCNQKEELDPKDPSVVSCKKFGWLISRKLSKTQAVCSR